MKNDISFIPSSIGESVSYSAGSIISKIIYKSDKLLVTLFAVAKGEAIEEHTTTKEAIVHILEGEGKFYLKDQWRDFKAGDYFYMPVNLIHAIASKTDFKFLLYQF